MKMDGIMLSVLQSLIFRMARPDAVMSAPPTMESSHSNDSLMALSDSFATR